MKRTAAILLVMLAAGLSARAQMLILPREKVDSMVRAQQGPGYWSSPFLSFDRLLHDAGTVSEHADPVRTVFKLKNIGSEALKFGRIETGCSCVSASLSPLFLPPDSTAALTVIYRQKHHTGVHPRHISLYLAEPIDTVVATVMVTAKVIE